MAKSGFVLIVILIASAIAAVVGVFFAVKSLENSTSQNPKDKNIKIEYFISGTFNQNADSIDINNLESKLKKFQAKVRILESFPTQFQISPLSAQDCREVTKILEDLEYIQYFNNCIPRPAN